MCSLSAGRRTLGRESSVRERLISCPARTSPWPSSTRTHLDPIVAPQVGADICMGSLIKNGGGTIVPGGGYVAGRADLVERAVARLTAPGVGMDAGCVPGETLRLMFQGGRGWGCTAVGAGGAGQGERLGTRERPPASLFPSRDPPPTSRAPTTHAVHPSRSSARPVAGAADGGRGAQGRAPGRRGAGAGGVQRHPRPRPVLPLVIHHWWVGWAAWVGNPGASVCSRACRGRGQAGHACSPLRLPGPQPH